jgi:metal-responsive CopG/Arc/MetJ family transcriptional regulator
MKQRITITIDRNLLEWLDRHVDSKIFANRSHGLEYLIARKMKEND